METNQPGKSGLSTILYMLAAFVVVLLVGSVILAGLWFFNFKKGEISTLPEPPTSSQSSSEQTLGRKVFPTAIQPSAAAPTVTPANNSPEEVNTGDVDKDLADLEKDLNSL